MERVRFCKLRIKLIEPVPSLASIVDSLFPLSLCPPISKESNVGDGFIVPDHQFLAGDAKCDLRKEQMQTISSIRRRHEKGRIHRMPNRTTVLVPKRTRSHRSQRQPSRHFSRKMLPAAKPTSRLAFHLPLSRLATELQQVTFSFRCFHQQ